MFNIIKIIDEIAFQTNLLALNAAEAAKDTSGLIEGAVKKIHDGTQLAAQADEAFQKVAESAGRVGELVGEIAAASNEQAQGIEQVNTAVTEMDRSRGKI